MKKYIGIDIGGTAIKYGIVDESGKTEHSASMPTQAFSKEGTVVERALQAADELIKLDPDACGIGISTAGVVDSESGVVVYQNGNLPGYQGTNWKEIISKRYGLEASVQNDVNAAALAESWIGAGRGLDSFFCMTVGTGIGGALFLGGQLVRGVHSRAAAIGYMNTDGEPIVYEKKASVLALINQAKAELNAEDIDGINFFARARADDEGYCRVLNDWCGELAKGIANVIYLVDPGVIIIGGGISREGAYLTDRITAQLKCTMPDIFMQGTEIRTAQYAGEAGIIGAVCPLVK